MSAAATMLEIASATRGVPPALTSAAFLVKKPSRPMASRMRGVSSMTALIRLNTVRSEITVTSSAPPCGSTTRAASAAGNWDAASTGRGSTLSMATLMITYIAATSIVPPMRARGRVRVGSVLSSAM